MEKITANDYKKLFEKSRIGQKYKNKKTEVDGIVFDSKAEAKRYEELKLLKKHKLIQGFARQPSFLLPGNIRYRPDFIVCDLNGEITVEDVKGFETKEFKLKKKLWEESYPWVKLIIIK